MVGLRREQLLRISPYELAGPGWVAPSMSEAIEKSGEVVGVKRERGGASRIRTGDCAAGSAADSELPLPR